MRPLATLLIAAAIVLVATDAKAAGRRRFLARQAEQRYVERGQLERGDVETGPIHRSAPLDPRAVYPQYQGGFHSRALQNIGVPTGDIGIRGNGFMMNPW